MVDSANCRVLGILRSGTRLLSARPDADIPIGELVRKRRRRSQPKSKTLDLIAVAELAYYFVCRTRCDDRL